MRDLHLAGFRVEGNFSKAFYRKDKVAREMFKSVKSFKVATVTGC